MATLEKNFLTANLSGRLGDLVFRQVKTRGGKKRTVVSMRPQTRKSVTPKENEKRAAFKSAAFYAKIKLLDPDVKAYYTARAKQAGFRTAYLAAVTDFLKAPSITHVYADNYTGVAGDEIWVKVLDNFKVWKATVTLTHADGTMIETGDAVFDEGNWKYVITQANASVPGTKISVTITDRPGKQATIEKTM